MHNLVHSSCAQHVGNTPDACGQKLGVLHTPQDHLTTLRITAPFIRSLYTLCTRIYTHSKAFFTPVNFELYTVYTAPINTTTKLNTYIY